MNEVQLELSCIADEDKQHFGGNQHWYKAKWHSVSGCGPTVAATILSHLAEKHPQCRALYKYDFPLNKTDFVKHMDEVREYVKPGVAGLTSKKYFACEVKRFAESRGVTLSTMLINKSANSDEAFQQIKQSINAGFSLALLILRNPNKEIEEFTWHWMVVIGYKEDKKIVTTSWGKIFDLDFDLVWNHTKKNSSGLVQISI
ncbi:MAG: C39 family peptidase [Clostridiales bacterium]|nr:C39 family peptidase [Clostridiales bacterium]